ncbi:sperm surface protein Sp17 isoform X2 [Lagopus muta]|uniref:sperm surface protein Sp17 isoform X2 n=1 Tax=Lagopus muta TaxID=64668 RepID=UPI00209F7E50|nr:sperm surface protein Sp17 isoform X2 [Lagopus muta]
MSFLDPRSAPQLPGGFEELLQGMAREVLRAQPDDVLGFIARYFQALLAEREQSSAARRAEDEEVGEDEEAEAEAPRSSGAEMERQRSSRDEDPTADFLTSQEAATKIQAAFRGFCTRRQLRRAFSEPPRPAPGPQDSP